MPALDKCQMPSWPHYIEKEWTGAARWQLGSPAGYRLRVRASLLHRCGGRPSPAPSQEIVMGGVRELEITGVDRPLLFFRGGFGQFAHASSVAPAQPDLLEP